MLAASFQACSHCSKVVQENHLRLHASKSGRMLIGHSEQPMSAESLARMKTVLEEDPAAADMAQGLLNVANMGLQVASSGSPAFSGLLLAKVVSASVRDLKNPEVQLAVEDDKVLRLYSSDGLSCWIFSMSSPELTTKKHELFYLTAVLRLDRLCRCV